MARYHYWLANLGLKLVDSDDGVTMVVCYILKSTKMKMKVGKSYYNFPLRSPFQCWVKYVLVFLLTNKELVPPSKHTKSNVY